jgi:hypothetical protein
MSHPAIDPRDGTRPVIPRLAWTRVVRRPNRRQSAAHPAPGSPPVPGGTTGSHRTGCPRCGHDLRGCQPAAWRPTDRLETAAQSQLRGRSCHRRLASGSRHRAGPTRRRPGAGHSTGRRADPPTRASRPAGRHELRAPCHSCPGVPGRCRGERGLPGRSRTRGSRRQRHRRPTIRASSPPSVYPPAHGRPAVQGQVSAPPRWQREPATPGQQNTLGAITRIGKAPSGKMSGGVLLSHPVPRAVPSALKGLTSGFGMGPGVSPSPWPPKHYGDVRRALSSGYPEPGARPHLGNRTVDAKQDL